MLSRVQLFPRLPMAKWLRGVHHCPSENHPYDSDQRNPEGPNHLNVSAVQVEGLVSVVEDGRRLWVPGVAGHVVRKHEDDV